MWPNLTKVEQTGSRSVSTFTRRPRSDDDPRPLLELPPPAAAVTLVPRSCWTPTGHHFRSAQGSSRTSRQGAFGRQLSTRAERRARGGAAQQHLGDRLRRWSGHQAGQRGVPGAGLPGWYNVGTQRKVWRRRGWEHFWENITIQPLLVSWILVKKGQMYGESPWISHTCGLMLRSEKGPLV